MADLNLKLVINGTNDGAIRALNQVVSAASASGTALANVDTSGTFSKTRAGLTSISTQLAEMRQLAIGFTSVSFLGGLAKEAIAASDEMKGIDARIRLASRSWQEYALVLEGVKKNAFEAGTALGANVALATRIADPIRAMGGMQQDVLSISQAVNNSLRITNASTAEGASAMLQFAQAMGAGVLQGEELKAILESAPRLAQAVADGLGITVGELKNLGAQGALTSQQVFNALKSQQATLAAEAGKLPLTVGQAWTNAQEGVKQYVAQIDQGSGATSALASAINVVAKNIPAVADALAVVAVTSAVAFGAQAVAKMTAYLATQRAVIAAKQLDAAASVRQAENELAVAQAVAAKAAAELRAVTVTRSYTLASNEAAAADARRAAAAKMAAANQAVGGAIGNLASANASAAAIGAAASRATLLGTALTTARTAGAGLLALFGGPWGLVITAIAAAVTAWELFGKKSKDAATEAQVPVEQLIKNFKQFSQKAGPNELEEQLVTLRERAADLRDQLLDPGFRKSEIGKQAVKDVESLDKAVEEADQRLKKFNSERVKEKGQLGLDKLKVDAGGLISDDMQKNLQAFDTLYSDFAKRATNDNGKLKVSALEAKAAIEAMVAGAKTPADFSAVINRLMTAQALNPKDSTLKSYLENAIESRFQAESKALDAMVVGMQARAQRAQAIFTSQAGVILGQFNQAQAMAKVAAELKNDSAAVSSFDSKSRNAEVAIAVASANQQIGAVEQVAARKRALVNESATAAKQTADAEIEAAQTTRDKNIANFEEMVAQGKATAGQLKDYRAQQEDEFNQKTATFRAARLAADENASRQIAQIDGQTAQQRAAIAESLYKTLQGKANEALSQYKTYAQQVISLDKSITNNRLDTMSAIGSIARQDATPKEQLQSLRDELAQIQMATSDAMEKGQKDYALELLNRQKSLASQIANVSGDGVEKKDTKAEAIDTLAGIGAQADAILQEQRNTAQKAAQEQLASYNQMSTAMTELASQISALNEQAAVKLKPEIDKASLDGAIQAVQTAFQNLTVPVKVTAATDGSNANATTTATTTSTTSETAKGYAGGGWTGPGGKYQAAGIVHADEFVIRQESTRQSGARAFLDRFNIYGMAALRGYATGGLVTAPSVINRVSIPSLSPAAQAGAGNTVVLDMGFLGKHSVRASGETQDALTKAVQSAARRFGRK